MEGEEILNLHNDDNFFVRQHNKFMKEALKEAKKAYHKNEVPIGAVIVKDGKIISRGHNLKETKQDATLHAEMAAIAKACKKTGSWRLNGCDMYVTLEPCCMCAGAIISSRINRLFIGALDNKAGAAGSVVNIFDIRQLNHRVEVHTGIMEEDCASIIKSFFMKLRNNGFK